MIAAELRSKVEPLQLVDLRRHALLVGLVSNAMATSCGAALLPAN